MPRLKNAVENFFLFIIVILNFFDFIEQLPSDLDFIKKIISWTLMIYLLYHLGFTKILIGYKNWFIDILLLISYTLFIFKDLIYYLFNTELFYFDNLSKLIITYQSEINYYAFNLSAIIMIFLAFYISKHEKIDYDSLLGTFTIDIKSFFLKFIISLLSISFVSYFIFNIVFQWFSIVIDAPIFMAAIVYYFFGARKYHSTESKLHKIASLGDRLLQKFITLFHSKRTIPIGLISLLTLHLFTDLYVFIIPTFIKLKDSLYYGALVKTTNLTIFQLFIQNAKGLDIYGIINLAVIYLSNLGFIVTLFIAPALIIKGIIERKSLVFHPIDKLVVIPTFLIYFIFPVYKITNFNSSISHITGVNITINQIMITPLLNFALLIFLFIMLAVILIYRFKFSDMTIVSLILIFIPLVDYVKKYFVSTSYYYIELIRKASSIENTLIVMFLFIFLLLITLFYWTSISLFIYETFRVNLYDLIADKYYKKSFMHYKQFVYSMHNLTVFLMFSLLLYLVTFFISTAFMIYNLWFIDFLIPIILSIILISLPKINVFFQKIDFNLSLKNVFLIPVSIFLGILFGVSFAYFREQLTFTSDSIIMIIIFLVFVAINEEILFRHYLQHYVSKVMSFKYAIIFQSLIFSLLHLPKGININVFIALFLFAYIITILKQKIGIVNAIVMHFAANLALYYILLF